MEKSRIRSISGVLISLALCLVSIVGNAADVASFRIVTGELPPFSAPSGPLAPGALAEMSQEIANRVAVALHVEFVPWQRAIIMPTKLSRVAVFPLTRTNERENQYRWLVKLYRQNFVFMGRKGGVNVQSLADLRAVRVAVLFGSPHVKTLKDEHFTQIVEVETVHDCIRMLHAGMVDAVYGGEAIHRSATVKAGYAESSFNYGLTLSSGDIWLAGSQDFSDADIAQLQRAFHEMYVDGTYARILAKYHLPENGLIAAR